MDLHRISSHSRLQDVLPCFKNAWMIPAKFTDLETISNLAVVLRYGDVTTIQFNIGLDSIFNSGVVGIRTFACSFTENLHEQVNHCDIVRWAN